MSISFSVLLFTFSLQMSLCFHDFWVSAMTFQLVPCFQEAKTFDRRNAVLKACKTPMFFPCSEAPGTVVGQTHFLWRLTDLLATCKHSLQWMVMFFLPADFCCLRPSLSPTTRPCCTPCTPGLINSSSHIRMSRGHALQAHHGCRKIDNLQCPKTWGCVNETRAKV